MASAAAAAPSCSVSVVVADERALPFPDASFDLVLDRGETRTGVPRIAVPSPLASSGLSNMCA